MNPKVLLRRGESPSWPPQRARPQPMAAGAPSSTVGSVRRWEACTCRCTNDSCWSSGKEWTSRDSFCCLHHSDLCLNKPKLCHGIFQSLLPPLHFMMTLQPFDLCFSLQCQSGNVGSSPVRWTQLIKPHRLFIDLPWEASLLRTTVSHRFYYPCPQKPGATFVSSVGSSTSISTRIRSTLLFTHRWVSCIRKKLSNLSNVCLLEEN